MQILNSVEYYKDKIAELEEKKRKLNVELRLLRSDKVLTPLQVIELIYEFNKWRKDSGDLGQSEAADIMWWIEDNV